MNNRIKAAITALSLFLVIYSCRNDKLEEEAPKKESYYPAAVADIIVNKCATSGCHTSLSKNAAAGLSLETWDELFEGGTGGAAVIPYSTRFSTMLYYTNTDSASGPVLLPTMPVNMPPLSSGEYATLKNWIAQGAPNKEGAIKFADNPNRKKFYVANQGCDVVTVFDAKSMLAMRSADAGSTGATEAPHMIKVSPDNQFWYTCFLFGSKFQKYSTINNTLIAEAEIGSGSWNTFSLSSDGNYAYAIDFAGGSVAVIDLISMTSQLKSGFTSPHGSTLNGANDTLYLTAQEENKLWKIPVNDFLNFEDIDLIGAFPPGGILKPHEVAFTPDGSKYFVTCQGTNEVRVVQTSNDSVVAAISVGVFPQEMAFSQSLPYLFVSCMEDPNVDPLKKSSVAVIDYTTNTLIKTIYAGYQSHGVAVDDGQKRVYVTNRNVNPAGPAPHHTSLCGGRNGNVTAINMLTLELIPNFKAEVSVDPYGIGITH